MATATDVHMSRRTANNLLKTLRQCRTWMSIECEGVSARQMRLTCPELARLEQAIARLEARINPPAT